MRPNTKRERTPERRERRVRRVHKPYEPLRRVLEAQAGERRAKTRLFLTQISQEKDPRPILDGIIATIPTNNKSFGVHLLQRALPKLDLGDHVKLIMQNIVPLLKDEDSYVRSESMLVVTNLIRQVGLVTMISKYRGELSGGNGALLEGNSSKDDQTVCIVFGLVGKTLGVNALMPLLRSLCYSQKVKNGQDGDDNDDYITMRIMGLKIIKELCLHVGNGILPHLGHIVGFLHENLQYNLLLCVQAIGLAAKVCSPYGFQQLEQLLEPLTKYIIPSNNNSNGPPLRIVAACMRTIGEIVPAMDDQFKSYYCSQLVKCCMKYINSSTHDENMRRAILITIIVITENYRIDPKNKSLVELFGQVYWLRRLAMDRQLRPLVVRAYIGLSKYDLGRVIERVVLSMKDESEPFRLMSLDVLKPVLETNGSFDLQAREIERILDGIVFIIQQSTLDDKLINLKMINKVTNIVTCLGGRVKNHIMALVSALLYRLQNKDPIIREQAADIIYGIVPILQSCGQEETNVKLCSILYESLGEVYPDVLGSILRAIHQVINVLPAEKLNPPLGQILSTLTPILKNRHDKVQEETIKLIGDLTLKHGAKLVPHREWLRVSFELLEMLKSYRKSIRREANDTFGKIAQVVGPFDLLSVLLNNLKMQDRQLRVCTSVAIGIVGNSCGQFTILPALMNEYQTIDKNVQNGVLKSLAFVFEYSTGCQMEYIYGCNDLITYALSDRDLVHRQISAQVAYHMSLASLTGTGNAKDVLASLLDFVWPNIFETSPHVIGQVLQTIRSLSLALGSGHVLGYLWQGLFHQARKVRDVYWNLWNQLYIDSQPALVAFMPRIDSLGPEMANYDPASELAMVQDAYIPELYEVWV